MITVEKINIERKEYSHITCPICGWDFYTEDEFNTDETITCRSITCLKEFKAKKQCQK